MFLNTKFNAFPKECDIPEGVLIALDEMRSISDNIRVGARTEILNELRALKIIFASLSISHFHRALEELLADIEAGSSRKLDGVGISGMVDACRVLALVEKPWER